MAHRSVIPFGPQHPVLPEPLHLDLVIEDDRVIEAIPQIPISKWRKTKINVLSSAAMIWR